MATIAIHDTYSAVDAADWDALVGDGSPFLEHAFLHGLEQLDCAVPDEGWLARPVLVKDDDDRLVAAAPGWLKGHSMGEFVYDHAWAGAAHRAGIPYYPKLVVAVPFTPVAGQRLLVHPDQPDVALRRRQLLAGLSAATEGTAGLHVLFDTAEEAGFLADNDLFSRIQFQFHWHNEGYADFDDWLTRQFKSKARNKIRRERRDVAASVSVEVVEQPGHELIDALHDFYSRTCAQFGPWGRVYLSRDFFHHLVDHWGDRLHAVVARDGQRVVGGAFNVRKGDRLYGRYWGCAEAVRFLHFEVCYYAPIEWCIRNGVSVFEPGHGGGHKYRRGFRPQITWSSHRLVHPRLHEAFEDHATREAEHVRAEAGVLTQMQRERAPLLPPEL